MKHLAPLLCLTAPLLLPELSFAPASGSSAKRTWVTTSNFTQRVADAGDEESVLETPGRVRRTLDLADRYSEVEAGRVTRWQRVFETIDCEVESTLPGSEEPEVVTKLMVSDVHGLPLEFRWNEKEARYQKSLQNSTKPLPKAFAGLTADASFAALLPPGAKNAGDTWTCGPAALAQFYSPGGDLDLRFKEAGSSFVESFQFFTNELGRVVESCAGKVELKLESVADERATISLHFDLDDDGALERALFQEIRLRRASPGDPKLKLSGTGELIWNRETNQLFSAVLDTNLEASWAVTTRTGASSASESLWSITGTVATRVTTR